MKNTSVLAPLVIASLWSSASVSHAQTVYTVTDLGLHASAVDINNHGQIVGTLDGRPFAGTGGNVRMLDQAGEPFNGVGTVRLAAINDAGEIIGIFDDGTNSHGFLQNASGLHDLGISVDPRALNARGNVVGTIQTAARDAFGNAIWHAFVTDGNGIRDLGGMGGSRGVATGINDNGDIVGYSVDASGNGISHGFLLNATGLHDLGSLSSVPNSTEPDGINNAGQIAGASMISTDHFEPFLADAGGMQLIAPGLSTKGFATDLNNRGEVVMNWGINAYLYDASGTRDIDSILAPAAAGWTILEATAINDLGQIVGLGIDPADGDWHGVLLTPVPLPAAVYLMGSGLLGIGGFLRRRNNV